MTEACQVTTKGSNILEAVISVETGSLVWTELLFTRSLGSALHLDPNITSSNDETTVGLASI